MNDHLSGEQIEKITNKMKKRTGKVWNIPPLLNCLKNDDQIWYTILLLLGSNHKAENECGEMPFKIWAKNLTEKKQFSKFDVFLVRWFLTNDDWLEVMNIASDNHSETCLKFLIENRKDIHVWKTLGASAGDTPLHIACKSKHLEMVDKLLKLGANVNARNCKGNSPLHRACASIEVIQRLVKEKTLNVNITNNKNKTPLMCRAENGNKDPLKILLENGADVNAVNNEGQTALHLATFRTSKSYIECLNLLIEYKANVGLEDNQGRTALHWAAEKGNDETLESLLKETQEDVISSKDRDGNTPLHLATEISKCKEKYKVYCKWKCHQILINHGAATDIK